MTKKTKVEKIIPSKLERGFQGFLYRTLGKYIPAWMTPNKMTLLGAAGGLFAVVCVLLTWLSPLFFIGVIAGVLLHLVADDLDGYIARSRNMASESGAFLDLITDILFSTFLLTALGFSPYVHMYIAIFVVPLYATINITALYNILYYKEFLFPRLGPIEAHLCYITLAVVAMVAGATPLFTISGIAFFLTDVILVGGGLLMFFEMFRMQVALFRRLRKDGR